jgi:hypothetical protein
MEWNQWGLVSACSLAVDRDAVCFAEPARPKGTDSKKGSISAADFRAFDPCSPPEADSCKTYGNPVRRTACRKTDEFPVLVTGALIGGLM